MTQLMTSHTDDGGRLAMLSSAQLMDSAHAPLPSVFERLTSMALAASRSALQLPRARAESEGGWRGLGFQIGGLRFAATIGDAVEVLRMPRLTPVPWVKSFVLGLANIRGRLLPVFDMHELLGLTPTLPRHQWRVLVAQYGDRHYGLTIEQSFGIQQFAPDAQCDAPHELGQVGQFVAAGYRQSGRIWYALELQRLVRDPAFMNVAV